MVYLRSVGGSRVSYGFPMIFLSVSWITVSMFFSNVFPMYLPGHSSHCFSHGVSTFFHGFPMFSHMFPWFSFVFPHFSHDFAQTTSPGLLQLPVPGTSGAGTAPRRRKNPGGGRGGSDGVGGGQLLGQSAGGL